MTEIIRVFKAGIYKDNPVFRQILGICSSLAVTNLLTNSLVMGVGLMFVTAFSSFTVSLLRSYTPKHIRMMVQTLIISAYVIMLDLFLKAYMPDMSKALGPYVGLIITNCIIMGRAEAFAQKNKPFISFFDGLIMGLGYTLVLLFIAFFRELLGFGTLFGVTVLGSGWVNWTLMIMPPGAFFMLGIVIWATYKLFPHEDDAGKAGAKA
ncbi:NADH:ubiquinone reductase (Na(+)-transporting) subunit D [Fusibacter tunisiensis]|jgi:Na+-transporting NADH:ubiquinone oxidoreductase subunit D|uniref:Na+-transporting NADH:ubiquinone oxidoreductase subunit D n=1 Tax=Fusibacter tunisiensis TaxID=1008308 RepID=A0ABS2MQ67_9FIRM|nr:NADH:ubiquinone reductase (Na(+)-transporting) subunit D [Fusibacter tunisiensis]MBM7561530.1 Na+-transporting NADH:ubiquinone oxidoreductase subunit D [Fusibacter tunisiensis]